MRIVIATLHSLVVTLVCAGCGTIHNYFSVDGLPLADKATIERYVDGHEIHSATHDFLFDKGGSLITTAGFVTTKGRYTVADGELCVSYQTQYGKQYAACWTVYRNGEMLVFDDHETGMAPTPFLAVRDDDPCRSALQNAQHAQIASKQQIVNSLVDNSIRLNNGYLFAYTTDGHFTSSHSGQARDGVFTVDSGTIMMKFAGGGATCVAIFSDHGDLSVLGIYGQHGQFVSR